MTADEEILAGLEAWKRAGNPQASLIRQFVLGYLCNIPVSQEAIEVGWYEATILARDISSVRRAPNPQKAADDLYFLVKNYVTELAWDEFMGIDRGWTAE